MTGKNTILVAIGEAIDMLEIFGNESHDAAMAMDRLHEAKYWASRMSLDNDEDGE